MSPPKTDTLPPAPAIAAPVVARTVIAGPIAHPAGPVKRCGVDWPGHNHGIGCHVGDDGCSDDGCSDDGCPEADGTTKSGRAESDVTAATDNLCLGTRSGQTENRHQCQGEKDLLHAHLHHSFRDLAVIVPASSHLLDLIGTEMTKVPSSLRPWRTLSSGSRAWASWAS